MQVYIIADIYQYRYINQEALLKKVLKIKGINLIRIVWGTNSIGTTNLVI